MKNHNLNVAERGMFVTLDNGKDYALDVFTVEQIKLVDKIVQSFQAGNIDLLELISEGGSVFLLSERLIDEIEQSQSFKNKLLALVQSLVNQPVDDLSNDDLHALTIQIIILNKDYFMGKLAAIAKKAFQLLKAMAITSKQA